jgi:hypothetical protein
MRPADIVAPDILVTKTMLRAENSLENHALSVEPPRRGTLVLHEYES